MRVDPEKRMCEPVTVVHRASRRADAWKSRTVEGSWQVTSRREVGADGTAAYADVLTVQIPEDQGEVPVSMGDYLVRGAFEFEGTTAELKRAVPEDARVVGSVRDRRGCIQGVAHVPILRWASALVLEAQ